METIRKRLRRTFTALGLGAAALALLLSPEVAVRAAAKGLQVCARMILPSLFPFFVLTNLWISTGYAAALSRLASPLMERVFHLSGAAAPALVLGAVGGYPVGAQVTAQLYRAGAVDRSTAHRMLFFCCNAGPAFLFAVAGAGVFQSVSIGALLYCIHILSALLLGVLFRPRKRPLHIPEQPPEKRAAFSAAFTSSVRQAGETALQVCFFVLFFAILGEFLCSASPSAWQGSPWFSFLLGFLELASGMSRLGQVSCSGPWRLAAAACLTGWGGLCVHCQTLSILEEADLEKGAYLRGKALHGLVSGGLALVIAPFLSFPVACMAQAPGWRYPAAQLVSLLLLAAVIGWFLKITSGKYLNHRL